MNLKYGKDYFPTHVRIRAKRAIEQLRAPPVRFGQFGEIFALAERDPVTLSVEELEGVVSFRFRQALRQAVNSAGKPLDLTRAPELPDSQEALRRLRVGTMSESLLKKYANRICQQLL